MELTVNLPPRLWYTNSSVNPGSYWPLDYPPLSGWQSWLHGQAMALTSSYGYESSSSEHVTSFSVPVSDLAVFFPAAWAVARVLHGPHPCAARVWTLASLLLSPALLIIDHGHFQYNCLSLGAAAGAAAAILGGAPVLGSLLYCLALNQKQMALYYAPVFFGHLLGRCLQARRGLAKVGAVARLGLVVVLSFALIWSPWLTSVKDASQLIRAGLQAQLCGALTLAAIAPSMLHQIMRPSPLGLMLAMANSAFAIFMFAFQVHEKSVLPPLPPISMMAAHYPGLAVWTPMVAMVSMYPLLERDGLSLPYVALMLLWAGLALVALPWPRASQPAAGSTPATTETQTSRAAARLSGLLESPALFSISTLALIALHAAKLLVPAPAHLPWLYDRAFIALAFAVLTPIALYLQVAQWTLLVSDAPLAPGFCRTRVKEE
ncbi:ALG6, ALG8 glycosyltransferase family-domain-containing protein [Haematococcus lacustris]